MEVAVAGMVFRTTGDEVVGADDGNLMLVEVEVVTFRKVDSVTESAETEAVESRDSPGSVPTESKPPKKNVAPNMTATLPFRERRFQALSAIHSAPSLIRFFDMGEP